MWSWCGLGWLLQTDIEATNPKAKSLARSSLRDWSSARRGETALQVRRLGLACSQLVVLDCRTRDDLSAKYFYILLHLLIVGNMFDVN